MKVIGRISEHPEGKDALVFPLLPEGEYIILGNPPSFDSITRDTFPNDKKLSISEINQILHDICQAAMHLHSCGIMHGDLYAHNILSKSCGKSLLTDFGAASFTKGVFGEKSVESKLLEQIEVRAFGNLADDLLRLCAVEERLHQDYSLIKNLVQQCTVDNVEQRPSFCQISAILDSFC